MVAGHSKGKLDENVTWYFDLVNVAMVLRVWMVLVFFNADFCWEFFFWGGFAVVAMFARKPLGGEGDLNLINSHLFQRGFECTN